ncbi:MAG: cytochrome P460 family protein [Burkholderiaceae bacterium]|nr:cytochrome P460 family protein [Burkholderiaceae bacterium]
MRRPHKSGVGVIAAAVVGLSLFPAMANDKFSPYVDDEGNIGFPAGFRTSMVHLGSWFVPQGEASGFHDVYTEKETVAAFRKTGKFPDGATLVKELRASNTGSYTTGSRVSYATQGLKQWFVMIKDAKGRFADNPLWGDGWGWALYKPESQARTSQRAIKPIAWVATFPPKLKTGSIQKPIQR